MQKYIKFLTLLFTLFISISVVVAKSENAGTGSDEGTENQQQESVRNLGSENKIQEKVQDRIQVRCEKAEGLVTKKLEAFNANKDKHVENFNMLMTKLGEISTRLETKGYDVSKFKVDISTFDSMVKEYAEVYTEFISLLEDTQNYACGESDGDFKASLQKAREQHKLAIEKRQAIREFYVEVLREDIKDLREQAQSLTEEE